MKGSEKYWGALNNYNHQTSCCDTNVVQRGCGQCFLRATSHCYETRSVYLIQMLRNKLYPRCTCHSRKKEELVWKLRCIFETTGYAFNMKLSRYKAAYRLFTSCVYKCPQSLFKAACWEIIKNSCCGNHPASCTGAVCLTSRRGQWSSRPLLQVNQEGRSL